MNYLDVYFSRVNHFGETTADRIKNSGIVAFEKWMARSPFTVTNLSVERGFYFSGIIETSKDREEKKLMYLYVANDIPIQVGDILTWKQDNGVTEKWLLLQQIHKVHPTYQTFQIIKCNYLLKWIDVDGYLRKSWAYAVSSIDSKVKSNFRMWHSLVSPQPNKFAEIIMPRPQLTGTDLDQLMRGITFIIENEGWIVIECDWTSVEGIVYMSLTESKVNYEYDDREVDVAETDRLKFPILPQTVYNVDDYIIPEFNTQTFNEWEIVLIPPQIEDEDGNVSDYPIGERVVDYERDEQGNPIDKSRLVAKRSGQAIVKMRLKNYDIDDPRKAVTKEFEITIISQESTNDIFISGEDSIKLDRYCTYTLLHEGTQNKVSMIADAGQQIEIEFTSENKDEKETVPLVSVNPAYDNNNALIPQSCVLHANSKNKIGDIILTATFTIKQNGEVVSENKYTKTVKIVPLW